MCDAAPASAQPPSAGGLAHPLAAGDDTHEKLLDGVLGRDRIYRQTGSELQPGDLAQTWVDLPVPVIGRVDLLSKRRGVQDEVVRRAVEGRRKHREDFSKSVAGRGHIGVRRAAEVGVVMAWDDPDLEG